MLTQLILLRLPYRFPCIRLSSLQYINYFQQGDIADIQDINKNNLNNEIGPFLLFYSFTRNYSTPTSSQQDIHKKGKFVNKKAV